MQPLNPFLRALLRSPVPAQAEPLQTCVALVPTTDSLLNAQDRDSGRRYSELIQDEDILSSHILRIPPNPPTAGKDTNNIRDTRGKAKSFMTINGRTVIIKENMVYSNKGFKSLTQAQLLSDVLYTFASDSQQLLLYYISRPLIGTFELDTIAPAILTNKPVEKGGTAGSMSPAVDVNGPKKKDIKTFIDLLNNFPMIARQMQPGLERLFNEFGKELGRPLPPPPSITSSSDSVKPETASVESPNRSIQDQVNGNVGAPSIPLDLADDEEDHMRRSLETAVTAGIDLFQAVDKQQLSLLGATTDLTGPLVERLIEKYITEQVHNSLLFPRLCSIHQFDDHELDRRIRQLENIDVSQVGIAIEGGRRGKEELIGRLNKGVESFRKIGAASGPHEMLDILLATERAVTEAANTSARDSQAESITEKQNLAMTVNADVLVSLLLIVIIRSQIRHLQARLIYMQRFIFIDDVESGEMGYALSTFEAVLTYLVNDSGSLRKASTQNKRLWQATKNGQTSEMAAIFEASNSAVVDGEEPEDFDDQFKGSRRLSRTSTRGLHSNSISQDNLAFSGSPATTAVSNLSHVFPFETAAEDTSASASVKSKKRVSMDMRSLSGSSAISFRSRTTTTASFTSGIEGDTSISSLSQTQDPAGNSVLMMAVESRQPESLRYLLTLSEYYPAEIVLDDMTSEGASLLSAAIQLASTELIDIILNFIIESVSTDTMIAYLAKVDERGRTAAHYLFNAPHLISKLGSILPWRKKDKIGQTPLFALCRSYDHPDYSSMVSEALAVAKEAQGDGMPLQIDGHADNKGNTLLHIVNDPAIIYRILTYCDSDPNAVNDKKFTPLMLASKYGRVDMVRVFFGDPRVDLHLKESRGLTAVELAKDDEVRNRIDDLTLLSKPQSLPITTIDGRITTIVRSYFVEDGSVRFIIKSGAPSNTADTKNTTFTITTCRRTMQDFETLAKWLGQEHPASYFPSLGAMDFRNPFQIHSRPSRAVLHYTQTYLDRFLKILLTHPTFGTHEALWEFFLVPDMQPDQISQRSRLKAELLAETIADEFEPIADVNDVEQVVMHSREMIRGVNLMTMQLIRQGHQYAHAVADLSDAINMASAALLTFAPPAEMLPKVYVDSFARHAQLMDVTFESSPLASLIHAFSGFHTTIQAIQDSLLRPTNLISKIAEASRTLARHRQNLNSQSLPRKYQFPGLEESRLRGIRETERKITEGEKDIIQLGKELRYTQEVVVEELAGWTEWREKVGREAIRSYVRGCVVREKERYKGLQRCLRAIREYNFEED